MKVMTEIASAVIYRNGAEIVRRGTVKLPAGRSTLYVYGLTESAAVDTARLFSAEGVRCTDLRFLTDSETEEEAGADMRPGGEETAAGADIEEQIKELNKDIELKQLQAQLLEKNGDFTHRKKQSAEEVISYIEQLPERLGKLAREIAADEAKIRELEELKAKKEAAGRKRAAAAEVTADQEGTYPLELRYHESKAGWRTVHELHTDGEGPVVFRLRAEITQNTGEDWKEAEVRLCTGVPAAGGKVPELPAVYVEFRKPAVSDDTAQIPRMPQFAGGAGMMMGMQMSAAMMKAPEPPAPTIRMETEQAEVNNEDSSTEYILPGTKDIPSGGRGITADLESVSAAAEYRVSIVPKYSRDAFLTAEVKSDDLPFTDPVQVRIYRKGVYSGKMEIAPDLTAEKTLITLGRDERVHAVREELARKSSASLLKGRKTVEYTYEFRITATAAEPVKVHLRDQIPVPKDQEITVELKEAAGASLDQESGIITWEMQARSGEKTVKRLSYSVSWPKDKEIREIKAPAKSGGTVGGRRFCPTCGALVEGSGKFCLNCGGLL